MPTRLDSHGVFVTTFESKDDDFPKGQARKVAALPIEERKTLMHSLLERIWSDDAPTQPDEKKK